MKNRIFKSFGLLCLLIPALLPAQSLTLTCGFDAIVKAAAGNNPNFRNDLARLNEELRQRSHHPALQVNRQSSASSSPTVAVVFHVVLDSAQMVQMGGQAGIITRIQSQ